MIINRKEDIRYYLFIVVLGGNLDRSHIETHDIRWVVGETIQDTYKQLREEWVGNPKGLHIDSYKRIEYIDGYKVCVKKFTKVSKNKTNKGKTLWFVNLGGYSPNELYEKHSVGLYAANSILEAKRKAKDNWLEPFSKKHNDNHSSLTRIKDIDNIYPIDKIKDWEIVLRKDPEERSQRMNPDWYGYKRIDN